MDTWYHLAACRKGNTLYLFIDGVLVVSGDMTGVTIYDFNDVLRVPGYKGSGGTVQNCTSGGTGWVDEVSIHKGRAIWTRSFDKPNRAA
jgi:hypothetical protein